MTTTESVYQNVKAIRHRTGCGVFQAKTFLEKADGDIEKAIVLVKEHQKLHARVDDSAKEGQIFQYNHNGKWLAAVELHCATDFSAKTEIFQKLGQELCWALAGYCTADYSLTVQDFMHTPWIKDSGKTIATLIDDAAAQLNEPIKIVRIVRWEFLRN